MASADNKIIENSSLKTKITFYAFSNRFVNFFLALVFITIPWYLGKHYWYMIEELYPNRDNRASNVVNLFEIPATLIPMIFFGVLYYFQFPYFEKYKANNVPWPW